MDVNILPRDSQTDNGGERTRGLDRSSYVHTFSRESLPFGLRTICRQGSVPVEPHFAALELAVLETFHHCVSPSAATV